MSRSEARAASPGITVARYRPNQRRWADLELWRLGWGLLLAPIIPYAAMVLVGEMLSNGFLLRELWRAVLVIAGMAVAWSLIAGPGYLLTVVRWRRRTGRIECLLLGTGIAATLPTAVILGAVLLPDWLNRKLNIGPIGPLNELINYSVVIGLIFAPFGLFGGWILWRAGVRPAPLPVPDVTAVFD